MEIPHLDLLMAIMIVQRIFVFIIPLILVIRITDT
jgi:hypothetical protein